MVGTCRLFFCHSVNAGSIVGICHEVVGILKPYHMLENLFELIALKGNWDGKTLGMSVFIQVRGSRSHPLLVLVPMSHLVKLSLLNIYLRIMKGRTEILD